MKIPDKNYAFIDGSYNPKKKIYGCGGILVDQNGKKHTIQDFDRDPNMVKMRNVAGEILGAMRVVSLAQNLGMDRLTIFYDYEGISAWPLGKWECRRPETKKYSEFILLAIATGLNICFSHVKAHTGIEENEKADKLAKIAVGLGRR